jgi:hypothetical protein
VLWDSDRHHFPDPDPYRYPFEPNVKLNYTILSKIWKIMTSMTLTRKIKKCRRLALLRIKVEQIFDFPTYLKLGVGSGSGSASKWNVTAGSGLATAIPIHYTALDSHRHCVIGYIPAYFKMASYDLKQCNVSDYQYLPYFTNYIIYSFDVGFW